MNALAERAVLESHPLPLSACMASIGEALLVLSLKELSFLVYGAMLDLYRENLLARGGESCSSC
jgi:hypothetical protein